MTQGSLSWRNNNPGNIRFGSFATAHGATGQNNGFAVFPDYESGKAAMSGLLQGNSYRNLTLSGAINRWSPPSENDTGGYVAAVSRNTGISPDTPLSSLTPAQHDALMAAMQDHEGWVPGSGPQGVVNGSSGNTHLLGGDGNDTLGVGQMSGYQNPGPPLTPQQIEAQNAANRPPMPEWLQKLQPKWMTPDRSDKLLAIGAGLLSGDDWASGIGGAAERLGGVDQQQKQRDLMAAQYADGTNRDEVRYQNQTAQEQANAQRDQGFAMDQIAGRTAATAAASSASGYRNYSLADGTNVLLRQEGGKLIDGAGVDQTANAQSQVTASHAGGDKGAPTPAFVVKSQDDLNTARNGLETMDRIMSSMDSKYGGAAGVVQQVQMYYDNLVGHGFTPEQIRVASAKGDMAGLLGASRKDINGPGVMTEPDAVRMLEFFGGDLAGLQSNPALVQERLKIAHANASKNYQTSLGQYNSTRDMWGKSIPMAEVNAYSQPSGLWDAPPVTSAAPLDQSNGQGALSETPTALDPSRDVPPPGFENTQAQWDSMTPAQKARVRELNPGALAEPTGPAAPEGVDPEDWKFMTPEQQALWLKQN